MSLVFMHLQQQTVKWPVQQICSLIVYCLMFTWLWYVLYKCSLCVYCLMFTWLWCVTYDCSLSVYCLMFTWLWYQGGGANINTKFGCDKLCCLSPQIQLIALSCCKWIVWNSVWTCKYAQDLNALQKGQ